MTVFAGYVGYATQVEVEEGVWSDSFDEKKLRGNIVTRSVSNSSNEFQSTDVTLRQTVSVVGDSYAFKNWMHIRYVIVDGFKWSVSEITIDRPRLNISLGGLYNGNGR